MASISQTVRTLAEAMASGAFEEAAIVDRVRPLLGGNKTQQKWFVPLVKRVLGTLGTGRRPGRGAIERVVRHDVGFEAAWAKQAVILEAAVMGPLSPQMAPAAGPPSEWDLPVATSLAELAEVLRIHQDDLGWLTSHGVAENYLYRWHRKRRSGAGRLIEIPKPLLKQVQRAVLDRILNAIPPHACAHGFRRGHSVRSYVEPHCDQAIVVKMDLEDFFPTVTYGRVMHLFLTVGYPEAVARALARLCTNRPPSAVLTERPPNTTRASVERLKIFHLPQGAPTSPALANLAAFRLDCRLAGLAKCAGARYTRYADDLLFSGGRDFARGAERFVITTAAIAVETGFHVAHRKTRLMRVSRRQRAAGVVVNRHPNPAREDFDRLKAILTNCRRHGANSQNHDDHPEFQAQLAGRIAWIASLNPNRGEKLRTLYDAITW